jgi:hypothetical protein
MFQVNEEVTVTEQLATNGFPRLYVELKKHTGYVQSWNDEDNEVTVTFPRSEFAPKSGYAFHPSEIAKKPPTILALYRETLDEIREGRNDQGYVMDMLYRIANHQDYSTNNAAFGLLGRRIVLAHVDRLNNGE